MAGPFCGQLLSSYGASVLRIDRPATANAPTNDLLTSRKTSIALDLKNASSLAILLTLLDKADVLIDPFRPGVLEKIGLDPESVLLKRNPRLIVVRLTGYRRDGKYSAMAGHDINYVAVSGVLSMLGARNTPPSPPANILGDFAGGGHVAFTGVLLALFHRTVSGKGQVVNANMVDGASYLGTFPRLLTKVPMWSGERGTNTLDGGCPYYGTYETKDAGRYMSVGALEPQFYAELLKGLGFQPEEVLSGKDLGREDPRAWPYMRELFTQKFRTKTRSEWEAIFDGTDACCAPVLEHKEMEAANYDHRPLVELTVSPALPVDMPWTAKALAAGDGGEETLSTWLNWKKGRDYDVQTAQSHAFFVQKEKSKL